MGQPVALPTWDRCVCAYTVAGWGGSGKSVAYEASVPGFGAARRPPQIC